jgi:hypothetical protein
MKRLLLLFGLLPAVLLQAQSDPAVQAARQWRQQHERAIVDEFVGLLSIPNVAADRDNIQRNATAIIAMMARRGIAAKLLDAPDANPVVFGEIRTPGATRTLAFYAHYDGQPLDPAEWATPPFTPQQGDRKRRQRHSASRRRHAVRSRVASLRAFIRRRQGAHRRHDDRARCNARRRPDDPFEHQVRV